MSSSMSEAVISYGLSLGPSHPAEIDSRADRRHRPRCFSAWGLPRRVRPIRMTCGPPLRIALQYRGAGPRRTMMSELCRSAIRRSTKLTGAWARTSGAGPKSPVNHPLLRPRPARPAPQVQGLRFRPAAEGQAEAEGLLRQPDREAVPPTYDEAARRKGNTSENLIAPAGKPAWTRWSIAPSSCRPRSPPASSSTTATCW